MTNPANVCHSGARVCWGMAQTARVVGVPANRATWWVMAGGDDRAWLCGMGEAAGWNSKAEYLAANINAVLENG